MTTDTIDTPAEVAETAAVPAKNGKATKATKPLKGDGLADYTKFDKEHIRQIRAAAKLVGADEEATLRTAATLIKSGNFDGGLPAFIWLVVEYEEDEDGKRLTEDWQLSEGGEEFFSGDGEESERRNVYEDKLGEFIAAVEAKKPFYIPVRLLAELAKIVAAEPPPFLAEDFEPDPPAVRAMERALACCFYTEILADPGFVDQQLPLILGAVRAGETSIKGLSKHEAFLDASRLRKEILAGTWRPYNGTRGKKAMETFGAAWSAADPAARYVSFAKVIETLAYTTPSCGARRTDYSDKLKSEYKHLPADADTCWQDIRPIIEAHRARIARKVELSTQTDFATHGVVADTDDGVQLIFAAFDSGDLSRRASGGIRKGLEGLPGKLRELAAFYMGETQKAPNLTVPERLVISGLLGQFADASAGTLERLTEQLLPALPAKTKR